MPSCAPPSFGETLWRSDPVFRRRMTRPGTMLFNSFEFIFAFLPAVVLGFACLSLLKNRALSVAWLVGASFFFYGWWDVKYVPLLAGSICCNFLLGRFIVSLGVGTASGRFARASGIVGNLALLGWFKYAGFLAVNIGAATGIAFSVPNIVLPLAISFFTFQQIAYLVHVGRDGDTPLNFADYALFVSFFPQLIAGPIVYAKEVCPQYAAATFGRMTRTGVVVGLTVFVIGLFKKVTLADTCAIYADEAFGAIARDVPLTVVEAWIGALAYSFQIYFDFSGYTDMAIGLACLFGVRLPLNFNSPYKAKSIIEFWRRWHMTLSRFLRDYLYIPLGGNRSGETRRLVNLMTVMLLGGLWHGAGWTFVIWGGLHGAFLAINQVWRNICGSETVLSGEKSRVARGIYWVLTLVALAVTWVVFRAENLEIAVRFWEAMAGLSGPLGRQMFANGIFAYQDPVGPWFLVLLLIVLYAPNTHEIMSLASPALAEKGLQGARPHPFVWKPGCLWGIVVGAMCAISLMRLLAPSPFLYFQF